MNRILAILTTFIVLQGCVATEVIKVAEVGSKSYETVKNAQSLGVVVSSIDTLADTRKIKAKTTEAFVKAASNLISEQPIEAQAELISQSIKAKVRLAENTFRNGFVYATSFWFILALFINILKYIINRVYPQLVSKIYRKS